jgi:hypothetical protein
MESTAANIFLNFGNFPQRIPIMVLFYELANSPNARCSQKHMWTHDEWTFVTNKGPGPASHDMRSPNYTGPKPTGVQKCGEFLGGVGGFRFHSL